MFHTLVRKIQGSQGKCSDLLGCCRMKFMKHFILHGYGRHDHTMVLGRKENSRGMPFKDITGYEFKIDFGNPE